jgi:DNA-binding MarR family transcriptional regulator
MNSRNRLERLIEEIRKIDPEMPAQTLHTLLFVSAMEPVPMRKLADLVGITPSSISRTCDRLGRRGAGLRPGLGLTVDQPDPNDERISIVSLTPRGREFVHHLLQIIDGRS